MGKLDHSSEGADQSSKDDSVHSDTTAAFRVPLTTPVALHNGILQQYALDGNINSCADTIFPRSSERSKYGIENTLAHEVIDAEVETAATGGD